MAKRHLKQILIHLKEQYDKSESIYRNFEESTKDIIISDEAMKPILDQKILLDNLLNLYSTAIRSAMYNTLEVLIKDNTRALSAFNRPLLLAVDNLSKNQEDEATKSLIDLYNKSIRSLRINLKTIDRVKIFKDLPNRKKGERRELIKRGLTMKKAINEYINYPIILQLNKLASMYNDFLGTPIQQSTKGDLDE